jgi:hypothetical protein
LSQLPLTSKCGASCSRKAIASDSRWHRESPLHLWHSEPDWDFKEAYKAELPLWVDRVLKPMVRPTEDRMASATALIAVGGGACLPGIDALLAKRNIQVLSDPLWANARGLYAYAVRKAAAL